MGVVTAISVAGVAAGVAALIIALAITNGMRRDLRTDCWVPRAHVELMRVEADGIRDWRRCSNRCSRFPMSPRPRPGIYEEVMVSHGPRAGFALVKGIIPAEERTVSNSLTRSLRARQLSLDPNPALRHSRIGPIGAFPYLGKDLADQIGVQVGDEVVVTSPQGELNPVIGLVPKFQSFKVAGIFHSGFYQYDSAWASSSGRSPASLR